MKYAIRMIQPYDGSLISRYWVRTPRGQESFSSAEDTITCWEDINEVHRQLRGHGYGNGDGNLVEEAPDPPSIAAWIAQVKAQQGAL